MALVARPRQAGDPALPACAAEEYDMPTPVRATRADDAARRASWTAQMDAAYRFMTSMLDYPVEECGEKLVALRDAAEEARVEVRFAAQKHVLGRDRLYYLREGQIKGFIGAAREMNQRGWVMLVEDGYRTAEIQKHLGMVPYVFDRVLQQVRWELDGQIPTPEFMRRRCTALVATIPKIGTHMSASAIDISVFLRDDPAQEVDRGGPYLEMSELTPMDSPFVSRRARENRVAITGIMRRHGFVEYPFEFWHYSGGDCYDQHLRDTGKPAIYGAIDWDPATDTVTPVSDPRRPLHSDDEIEREIAAALDRLRA
jgi:D-alanyl-D-alanine dipeptidase